MPQRLKKTNAHRAMKAKKMGASGKSFRENHGTTPSVPATGPIQATRGGRVVKPESIKVPASK